MTIRAQSVMGNGWGYMVISYLHGLWTASIIWSCLWSLKTNIVISRTTTKISTENTATTKKGGFLKGILQKYSVNPTEDREGGREQQRTMEQVGKID